MAVSMINQSLTGSIQPSFLRQIADKKFLQGQTTIALMADATTDFERLMIAAVSLLEVNDTSRFFGMSGMEAGFVKECHDVVQGFLAEHDYVTC
jgi:hypothetical protein